jgi:small subunit ribosomal protein S17
MSEEAKTNEAAEASADGTARRSIKKRRVGLVVSDKMDKSVVVRVTRRAPHPLYKKVLRRHRRYMAHDEQNECKIGDTVEIVECRPLSKRKSWRVRRVLSHGN